MKQYLGEAGFVTVCHGRATHRDPSQPPLEGNSIARKQSLRPSLSSSPVCLWGWWNWEKITKAGQVWMGEYGLSDCLDPSHYSVVRLSGASAIPVMLQNDVFLFCKYNYWTDMKIQKKQLYWLQKITFLLLSTITASIRFLTAILEILCNILWKALAIILL